MPWNVARVVEDTKYLYSCSVHAIDYSMAIADQAAESAPPRWLRFPASRKAYQPIEGSLDVILIAVSSITTELCFPVLADFRQIGASGSAQDDFSHVGRGVRRRFP